MSAEAVGVIGLGLVWGWLVAAVLWRPRRALLVTSAVAGATAAVAAAVVVLSHQVAAIWYLLGSGSLATLAHLTWLRGLYERFGRDEPSDR